MADPSLDRYVRQTIFPHLGEAGQRKLLDSRVTVMGCGATGTVVANHLARAGIGRLKIVDRDFVEMNNLQRQLLFDEEDVLSGTPKAIAAQNRLRKVNSEIDIEGIVTDINSANIEALIDDADLVMDATDNFETRYILNDACVRQQKPWVYCAAVSSYGMTLLIRPGVTPCMRCLFPDLPPPGAAATCDTAGVLGPAVSVIASIACTEAIKFLIGAHDALIGRLVHIDVWDFNCHSFETRRNENCPCCVQREFPFLEASAASHAISLCGRNAIQITTANGAKLDLKELGERLQSAGEVTVNPFLLRFVVDEYEMTIFPDARAIIKGTQDEAVARTLYSKYVGM